MKKIAIGFTIVLVLCLILAALAPFIIDLNKYKGTILSQLEPYFPREVDFQSIEMTILTGLGAEIRGLRISDNPAFSQEDFLRLESLQVQVQILPLIKKQIKVKKIILKQPVIRLARNIKGAFSFDDLITSGKEASKKEPLPSKEKPKQKEGEGDPQGPGMLAALLVNELEIEKGKILYLDEMLFPGASPISIDGLDLKVEDVSLQHPISIEVAANITEAPGKNFHLKGTVGPVGEELQLKKMPLDIRVSFHAPTVESLKYFIPEGLPLQVLSGSLSINLEAKGSFGEKIVSKSDIELQDLIFQERREDGSRERSGKLRCTLTHRISMNYHQQQIFLESGALSLNGNRVLLKGIVKSFLTEPQWDLRVWTEGFRPGSLMALFPMYASNFPEELQIDGPVEINLQSSGSQKKFHIETKMDMNAMKIQYSDQFQKSAGMPLSIVWKADKEAERLNIRELQLVLHHLVMTASGKITIKEEKPHFDFLLQTRPVSLEDWDTIVPLLFPYQIKGSFSLRSSLRGTPEDASFKLQASSERLGFDIPPSGDQKQAAATGHGIMEAVDIEMQGKKKADEIGGSGKLEIEKGEILSVSFERLLSNFQYTRDQLKIAGLELEAFQGAIQCSGSYEPAKGNWSFEPVFKGIEVGKALNNLTEYKDIFSGRLSGRFEVRGSIKGDKKQAMHANGEFRFSRGELKNFNLAESVLDALFGLKAVARFLSGQRNGILRHDTTQFDSLEGKLEITGKTLNFKTLQLHNIHTSKATDSIAILKGKCSMDDNSLDLKGKLILSKRHSQELARKADVLEALFDREKRMVLPITIKGSIQKPVPLLDKEYVLEALTKHYTRKAVDKGIKELRKKLQVPEGKGEDRLQKPVERLLKDLFGK